MIYFETSNSAQSFLVKSVIKFGILFFYTYICGQCVLIQGK